MTRGSHYLKPVRERIVIVDPDFVAPRGVSRAFDRRDNRMLAADFRLRLDAADEAAADIALVHERIADLEPPLRDEMRHARRRAGAARAAVDGLVAIKHRVARIGARTVRRIG